MNFLIIIGKAKNNYGAYSPDVPVIATGKTVEKTISSMREALALYAEETVHNGKELVEPKTLEQHIAEGNLPELEFNDIITHVAVEVPEIYA